MTKKLATHYPYYQILDIRLMNDMNFMFTRSNKKHLAKICTSHVDQNGRAEILGSLYCDGREWKIIVDWNTETKRGYLFFDDEVIDFHPFTTNYGGALLIAPQKIHTFWVTVRSYEPDHLKLVAPRRGTLILERQNNSSWGPFCFRGIVGESGLCTVFI